MLNDFKYIFCLVKLFILWQKGGEKYNENIFSTRLIGRGSNNKIWNYYIICFIKFSNFIMLIDRGRNFKKLDILKYSFVIIKKGEIVENKQCYI